MNTNELIGRDRMLFEEDFEGREAAVRDVLAGRRVLVVGGAGSIGSEVVKQVFRRDPSALHVIDISENNLAELVRDIRSSLGYLEGESRFLPLDVGSPEAAAFIGEQPAYDVVLNLAALKHVRSEKDAYSLMRMIKVNVLDATTVRRWADEMGATKCFAVSTDKATNPANLMGATKRIMEDSLFRSDRGVPVSTARFANVAFSDGSLLHAFRQRLAKGQPISAPNDVRRYFLTQEESGLLCLASIVFGEHREIFFPKLEPPKDLVTFSDIARRFLESHGLTPVETDSEEEARRRVGELHSKKMWPVYFFSTDTAGEKPVEEFFARSDETELDRFQDIGVIHFPRVTAAESERLDRFIEAVLHLRESGSWTKSELVEQIEIACPDLAHVAADRSLDERM